MPTSLNTINLIRTKTSSSPQLDAIEASVRRSAYIGVAAFLCIGVIMAIVYYLFYFENLKLQKEKTQLIDRINAEKNKEGLLIAIKDRTRIVQKAMGSQKPWTKTLDLVATFASPPTLSSLSVDEQNKVVLGAKAGSLDEVLYMVNTIIVHTKENRIKNPQLISFQLGKNGEVEATISFFALF
ncbi:hypothetical protein A3A63_01905 [Candidatus Gottesmanbacteria bacterium RIFCSPLOWO2_01_FULL_46_9]|uniref:Fimbrial assembly protein n=1 Tax=Candidatus Gottesmanbacteria bacterium RIFCSPLOWO2_01_FULL_46_9 TaxID=1798394 RepID=A0A1F6B0Y5_9BACT|nr:MAG: hypothetical protein A3A63_01905 [Candidatus Gottesmanbacteria bacterium RIFCSPLOWO2_01_FULL_46_9]